jgi:hypothetical protein
VDRLIFQYFGKNPPIAWEMGGKMRKGQHAHFLFAPADIATVKPSELYKIAVNFITLPRNIALIASLIV